MVYSKNTNLGYTVNYYKDSVADGNLLGSDSDTGTFEAAIPYTDGKYLPAGYVTPGTVSGQTTITAVEADNVLNVVYSKNTNLTYTVNYYWMGTTTKVADSKTVDKQTFDAEVTESAIDVTGYTKVDTTDHPASVTFHVTDPGNVINFYYYKNVELTANSGVRVYNGSEQTITGFTGAPEGVTFAGVTASGSGIAASTTAYPVTFSEGTEGTKDTTDKYIVSDTIDGTLIITAKSILPDKENNKAVKVEKPGDTTYNGVSQQLKPTVTDPETGKTLVENKDYTLSYSKNTTDAGTVTVTITGKGNYQGTTETTYQITKRPVTVVGDGWAEAQVYNTTEYSKNTYTFSNVVAGQTATITYSIKGTDAGSYTGTFGNDFKVMSGETDVTANYELKTKTPGKLTITKAKEGVVTVTGNSETYVWTGDEHEVTGFTHDGAARLITVELKKGAEAAARGTAVGTYEMGLKAENFTASSPNYETVKVVVVDGELVIETINITVTVTVRGNKETVTFDGNPHTVTGYKVISAIANTGRDMGMDGFTLTLKGTASATGTEIGTYNMGLTAGDFTITSDIYRVVRVVVEDGGLEITPAPEEPTEEPTEEIPEETVPLAPPEEIPDEPVPQAAGPAWALINLILSILTVLASLLLLVGYFGKKEEEAQDENGNPILDAEGNSLMNNIKKRGGWRLASLVPAILSVIAFLLTENMRNPMILVDRWTLLMVIIAVAQVLVMLLSKKKTEEDAQEA